MAGLLAGVVAGRQADRVPERPRRDDAGSRDVGRYAGSVAVDARWKRRRRRCVVAGRQEARVHDDGAGRGPGSAGQDAEEAGRRAVGQAGGAGGPVVVGAATEWGRCQGLDARVHRRRADGRHAEADDGRQVQSQRARMVGRRQDDLLFTASANPTRSTCATTARSTRWNWLRAMSRRSPIERVPDNAQSHRRTASGSPTSARTTRSSRQRGFTFT